jgi:hypothetical protein
MNKLLLSPLIATLAVGTMLSHVTLADCKRELVTAVTHLGPAWIDALVGIMLTMFALARRRHR